MNRSRLALLPASIALLLAACGGNSVDGEPVGSVSASEAAAASEPPSSAAVSEAAGGGEATVTLTGFAFDTAELTVPAGTEVTFVNDDAAPHTVTEGSDGETAADPIMDAEVAAGESTSFTFDEPGTYQITCRFHPTMNMTVVVEG